MLLVIILLLNLYNIEACVYSQSYWLSNVSEPWPLTSSSLLSQPLCGISWYKLMHLNTSQTRDAGSMHFLLGFHQLCTACLNMCIDDNSGSVLPSSVSLATVVIFDSMQRYCHNLQGWVDEVAQDRILSNNLKILVEYNHGENVCDPVLFSFTHEPQLFFLSYNETEQGEAIRRAIAIQELYRTHTFLTVFSCFSAFLIIPGLVLYIIMIHNKRRQYTLFKSATEIDTYDASGTDYPGYDENIEFDEITLKDKVI